MFWFCAFGRGAALHHVVVMLPGAQVAARRRTIIGKLGPKFAVLVLGVVAAGFAIERFATSNDGSRPTHRQLYEYEDGVCNGFIETQYKWGVVAGVTAITIDPRMMTTTAQAEEGVTTEVGVVVAATVVAMVVAGVTITGAGTTTGIGTVIIGIAGS